MLVVLSLVLVALAVEQCSLTNLLNVFDAETFFLLYFLRLLLLQNLDIELEAKFVP